MLYFKTIWLKHIIFFKIFVGGFMIKQIKYFQSVVRNHNFTKAAEENFISQSAISQQIQALEKELGVKLLQREGRKFKLTPAGEFFYRKSLVIVNDFDRLCRETLNIANGQDQKISIGYLKNFSKDKLIKTVVEFNEKNPEMSINLVQGTHEELYELLRTGKLDIVINDLRRKPSDQYVNFFLTDECFYAELPAKNPLAQLDKITAEELKNTPIILIAPVGEHYNEEIFYREYFGIKSEFIFAEDLDSAHLMVVLNKGYFPATFKKTPMNTEFIKYVPIFFDDKQMVRKYYAFWKMEATRQIFEDFAEILKSNTL